MKITRIDFDREECLLTFEVDQKWSHSCRCSINQFSRLSNALETVLIWKDISNIQIDQNGITFANKENILYVMW